MDPNWDLGWCRVMAHPWHTGTGSEGNWQHRTSPGKGLQLLCSLNYPVQAFPVAPGEDVSSQGLGQAQTFMKVAEFHCSDWLFL